MANPIKYSTGSETLALKKGNFYIGTGAVGKGPTSETGYYNGITPPSGGYTIYLNKESNGPSIYTVSNDTELISLTNSIAGQSYTTVNQCFDYYYGQTDKVLVNQDYPADYPYIVMDGLVLNLDAGMTQSYPGSGTVWTDVNGLGPKNNGTLINGPTFDSDNGGSIVFDGVDDYALVSGVNPIFGPSATFTVNIWIYTLQIGSRTGIWGKNDAYEFGYISSGVIQFWSPAVGSFNISINNNDYLNQWKMITATNSSNGSFVYTNSTQIGSNSQLLGDSVFDFGVMSGTFDPPGNSPLAGRVGLIQVYNRALSAQEVLQNYNATKGRFGL
jgi:hypothetical protein